MTLKWYINRIKLMSMREILFFRIPQVIQKMLLGHFQSRKNPKTLEVNPKYQQPDYSKSNLFFQKKKFSYTYPFYTVEVDISDELNFREDTKNNITSKKKYYNKFDRQNFEEVGDIKYVSELARLHFLPYLALNSVHSNNEEDLKLIHKHIKNWHTQNPYLQSIHWTSGIEVAIRAINLTHTHKVLRSFSKVNTEIDKLIKTQISYSYHYLSKHLSKYSSANNHLMAELAGLVIISCYWDNEKIKRKRDSWIKQFYKEIEDQTLPDGGNMELSSRYHVEVTDHILQSLLFVEATHTKVSESINNILKKSINYISHLTYKGENCQFGDSDDGHLIYPYFDDKHNYFESLLQSSNIIFSTNYSAGTQLDFRNYLIFGDKPIDIDNRKIHENEIFIDTGYAFLYDPEKELKLSFDFGRLGDHISAAHAHSDMLSFTLQVGDQPIFVDPGTYQYHSKDIYWRDYFRSIKAHNTISIEGMQHGVINNRMSWVNAAKTDLLDFDIKNSETVFLEAETNAFKSVNCTHRRKIALDKRKHEVTIYDRIENTSGSEKNVVYYLHMHPAVEIESMKNGFYIHLKKYSLKLEFFASEGVNTKIVEGDDKQPLGWYSINFDRKTPSKVITIPIKVSKDFELETKISYTNI